jgi:hypothetical protein
LISGVILPPRKPGTTFLARLVTRRRVCGEWYVRVSIVYRVGSRAYGTLVQLQSPSKH